MYESIPAGLKRLPNWVNWRFADDPDRPDHKRKIPINPVTLDAAQSNNAATWASFDVAVSRLSYGMDGIGFMFAPAPDGTRYFGVDLDGCDDAIAAWKRGEAAGIVAEFIQTLGSYAEYSVSGRGVHILCRGSLPPTGRRRGNVEMYDSGRFFIMTGNAASDFTEIADGTEAIKPLHEKYIHASAAPTVYRRPEEEKTPEASEIIDLASKSKQGRVFTDLMAGNWDAYYASQSEADLALCNMLAFWCRRDERLMDSIFRTSGLMREKWDRRQSGTTYGAITVGKAARECANVYERTNRSGYRIGVHAAAATQEPAAPDFSRYTLDDTGIAVRMADMFGAVLRYCFPEKRFYYFDGRRWCEDNTGAVYRMADDVIAAARADQQAYVDAFGGQRNSDELREEYMKFVKKCRSNMTKQSIVKELRARVPVLPAEFDTHIDLLNTPSGVVDLSQGTITAHNPELLITRVTVAEYSDRADCPMWEKFLGDIFSGNKELIHFVHKAIGYSLTASVAEQVVFFAVGDGSNGKSTFFETLAGALGDYASNAQPQTILAKTRPSDISSDLARLKGARFVTVPEPAEGARLDEGLVKQLTGGDRVTARKLYADEMEFSPEFKIWMGTNHKPVIRGTDFGIWRRLCIIPFTVKIPANKVDKHLRYKLMREYPGILRWAVDGALAWKREGLAPYPACIRDALSEYRNEMDVFSAFLSECTTPEGEVSSKDLYRAYVAWAKESNEYVMSAIKFGRECGKRFENRHARVGTSLIGVSLNSGARPYRIVVGGQQ